MNVLLIIRDLVVVVALAGMIVGTVLYFERKSIDKNIGLRAPDITTTDGRYCWVVQSGRVICREGVWYEHG